MIRILVVIALLYVAWCTALYLIQDQITFPANFAPAPLSEAPYPDTIVLTLEGEAGEGVYGWFVPAPGCDADHPAPVIVFFHGNAEIIDYLSEIVAEYRRLGCSVFLPEYRGYGRCPGRPSRIGIQADCLRFHDLLAQRAEVDASRIVFHGRSLGGAVAADVAAHRKPAAMLLQSTFLSAEDLAHRFYAPGFLVRHRYHTDRVVAEIDIPLMILHGRHDPIIPVEHGRRLYELAKRGTYFECDCGHNDLTEHGNGPGYWLNIKSFLWQAGIIESPED
jgi:fermentation-respiration switch protein FrsA (DUF1100 family)